MGTSRVDGGSYARLGPECGSMLTGLSAPACGCLFGECVGFPLSSAPPQRVVAVREAKRGPSWISRLGRFGLFGGSSQSKIHFSGGGLPPSDLGLSVGFPAGWPERIATELLNLGAASAAVRLFAAFSIVGTYFTRISLASSAS